ncbi:hypothetical protein J2Z76_001574 [Sedimentibacter acidaminivorans]|uniref:Motility associated factor glycosyltransferase family protein n=1 Tax=Sedimentibacter acidaminivorans TaxID=913099 RepID=A0ABS4GDE7_9FIRM|nr:6-hydroxymethylpterin diphosphokinase MptE-like protein [Sedimentibacter acidaminivorans]MBP1925713.1 hypothetical protein [Sedimentibacter acidaminivorans]
MLADNIIFLKRNHPELYTELKKIEENKAQSNITIENTKNNQKTVKIEKDNGCIYLHSKYNPFREAESIINKLEEENVDKDTHVIFYGIGLGYHLDVFIKRYPNTSFSIYEPSIEIFRYFLEEYNIQSSLLRNLEILKCEYKQEILDDFFKVLLKKTDKKIVIMELPIYANVFEEQYSAFLNKYKELIKNKRRSMLANFAYQKRWIINSMKNLRDVLSTPNIIMEKSGEFKGKTAILVAAGPSLNEEIENLRTIKDKGLAYIFSVGSAVNTLIYNNINPDAACTYDPSVINQKVFKSIKEKGIKDIPLIFGSSVGYETLENYLGNKYHIITSQDSIAGYYLKSESDESISIVYDAPSIAVVTMQLLCTLGFSNVLLVGQNLGFRGKERYSEGISYSRDLTDEEIKKGIWVKDVYGNEILTNDGFNSMRLQMESYIELFSNVNVVNTTKGGANIKGTEFIELKEIMEKSLNEKMVEGNSLDINKTSYDKKHLESQSKLMDKAYNDALKINKEYKEILSKIEKAINNRRYTNVENLYLNLDKELRKIEHNYFYKTFILPMNRVQYEMLADSIVSLNNDRNPDKKARRVLEGFGKFIDICIKDMDMIKPIYDEMNSDIVEYISSNSI